MPTPTHAPTHAPTPTPQRRWLVRQADGKRIDVVRYAADMDAQAVRRALIQHDGFPEDIAVETHVALIGDGYRIVLGTALRADDAARIVHGIDSTLKHALADEDGTFEPPEQDYATAVDAIESLVLAQWAAGIDVTTPAYLEALNTAVTAIAQHLT